nr:PREDICTED: E3 ubiquitin-protein ligase CHFR [Latimeria chalumnae]|eukprot:XP_005990299.1 PREDICTED: E3 ubiquitin-protein ligase CHFR [Latimeria chalumnae]
MLSCSVAMDENKPWGKLTRQGAEEGQEILLDKKQWTIGRKKGHDLSFPGNKLVSGDHCKIVVDQNLGQVFLEDSSTNGTVVNKVKVIKKQTYPLQNGDVIYIVYRKSEPEQNVAYLYNSLNAEEVDMQEFLDAGTSDPGTDEFSGAKQNFEEALSASPKRLKAIRQPSYEESQPSTSSSNLFAASAGQSVPTKQPFAFTSSDLGTPSITAGPSCSTLGPGNPLAAVCAEECQSSSSTSDSSGVHSNSSCKAESEASTSALSDVPAQDDLEEPAKKKLKTDELACAGFLAPDPLRGPAVEAIAEYPSLEEEEKANRAKPDKMEETLTCIICQDLLHDCISLQPCMHTFCAACYSGWMEISSRCPTCRCPVERICKNHMLNNLVEAYLLQHPEKCRSEEDLHGMDARNKITQDMLQPKINEDEGSSDDLLDLSDVDSESSDTGLHPVQDGFRESLSPPPFSGHDSNCLLRCRRIISIILPCFVLLPCAQEYMCLPQRIHAICTCCLQAMPDRRAERALNPSVPPQQCMVCLQPFCHMYWGCSRVGCFGCLAPFCEINLGEKSLDGVLNNNDCESDILKNYLVSRGLTWKDLLNESFLALQRGLFVLSDFGVNSNTLLCYCCGLRNFRELAYQYRKSIPASDLPAAVTSRPDCYWGRNCRTQVKAHHAMKFNHICEQTRFKS